MSFRPGIENVSSADRVLMEKKIGLVTNPTGVNSRMRHDIDILRERYNLVRLFGPEHGIRGAAQAGDGVKDGVDRLTGIPEVSLFGREVEASLLDGLEALAFDMQDIGARFYTYTSTLSQMMHLCAAKRIPLVVFDRYNPLGLTRVEGGMLEKGYESFVGLYPVPARHGLTMGEFARMINREAGIGCDLTVIPCSGLTEEDDFRTVHAMWVPPSPNIPTYETALCYIGTCFFEGTNLSEGRGTTRPFETIGAPFLDGEDIAGRMNDLGLPGVLFRGCSFTPLYSKYQGKLCGGVMLHLTDHDAFEPFRTGVTLLNVIRRTSKEFAFWENAGEYFIDHLFGSDRLRKEDFDPESFIRSQNAALEAYRERIKPYKLYAKKA